MFHVSVTSKRTTSTGRRYVVSTCMYDVAAMSKEHWYDVVLLKWYNKAGTQRWWRSVTDTCFFNKYSHKSAGLFCISRLYHYENMPIQIYWNFYHKKTENFQIKNSDIFHISAQNIDCGYSLEPPRRGGSNEYPQSMFLSRNKKIMYTPVNPSFTI